MSHRFLPVFVDLEGALVLVAGGDAAAVDAARRLRALGARVRLVARDVASAREALDADDGCELAEGAVLPRHHDGAVLIVVGTDEEGRADLLARAEERGQIVADVAGSSARAFLGHAAESRGLLVGVSTRARSPESEPHLTAEASAALREEHERLVTILGGLRERLAERFPDAERRDRIWGHLLDRDSPVLPLLVAGEEDQALELAERMAWGTG